MARHHRNSVQAALLTILVLAGYRTFGQAVPEAALKAGFSAVTGKTVGAFQVTSLSGLHLNRSMTDVSPVLFHIWSSVQDPSGAGLVLVAAFQKAMPEASIFVVSSDTDIRTRTLVTKTGIKEAKAISDAQPLIRALGGPSAPAWIFVAPGGEIVAYRLGYLASGLDGIKALFNTYTPAEVTIGNSQIAPTKTTSSTSGSTTLNTGVTDSDFAQAIEIEIVAELNRARTQPKQYAQLLREYRKFINGNYFERTGEITVVLNEGVKAVDEAIAFLERQKPLPPLILSRGLSLAAMDHARDQGATGQTGHAGSDRSTMAARIERYGTWQKTAGENIAYGAESARDVVIQLIIDDGVASRGHRTNIFNASFLVVGVAFGTHPGYRTMCVQDFAGGYTER